LRGSSDSVSTCTVFTRSCYRGCERDITLRLLHTKSLTFEEFYDSRTPNYAILSHRWEEKEVSCKEMRMGTAQAGQDLSKIHSCCKLAARRGFAWVWIDTCCIDKKSSAELTNQSIRCSDGMRTAQSATYIFPMYCGIAEPRGIPESSSSGAHSLLAAGFFRNF